MKGSIYFASIRFIAALAFLSGLVSVKGQLTPQIGVFKIIDAAVAAAKQVPGYVGVTHEQSDGQSITTTLFVRNDPKLGRLIRWERVAIHPGAEPQVIVRIKNATGLWQVGKQYNIRLLYPVHLERPIPTRMPTAELLRFNPAMDNKSPPPQLVTTIEEGVDFFGHKSRKISIAITPEDTARVKELVANSSAAVQGGSLDPSERAKAIKQRIVETEGRYPAVFIYYIDESSRLVLSWQAFSVNGVKMADVSMQDLELANDLEIGLFTVPDLPVKNAYSAEEYAELAKVTKKTQ